MPQVTITDVKDITEMKDIQILRWISLHKEGLESEEMKEYWDKMKDDLKKLQDEYDIRHPEIVILRKILSIIKPSEILDTIGKP